MDVRHPLKVGMRLCLTSGGHGGVELRDSLEASGDRGIFTIAVADAPSDA